MPIVKRYEALLEELRQRPRQYASLLIAVDGCGASGKSVFAQALARLDPAITVVHMDDFYLPTAQRPTENPQIAGDYDIPRFAAEVIEPLIHNQPANYQRYDWSEDRLAELHTIPTGGIVIIEGVYSLMFAPAYDYRIWVECPYAVRLARGIARDGEDMRDQWVSHWMPAEERYIHQYAPAQCADLVVDGAGAGDFEHEFTVLRESDRSR